MSHGPEQLLLLIVDLNAPEYFLACCDVLHLQANIAMDFSKVANQDAGAQDKVRAGLTRRLDLRP